MWNKDKLRKFMGRIIERRLLLFSIFVLCVWAVWREARVYMAPHEHCVALSPDRRMTAKIIRHHHFPEPIDVEVVVADRTGVIFQQIIDSPDIAEDVRDGAYHVQWNDAESIRIAPRARRVTGWEIDPRKRQVREIQYYDDDK